MQTALFNTPAEQTAAPALPDSWQDIANLATTVYEEAATFEYFTTVRDLIKDNRPKIEAAAARMTVAELKKKVYSASGDTKARLVDKLVDNLLTYFTFGNMVSWQPFSETWAQAMQRQYDGQTPEGFYKYKAERAAQKAAKIKALTNPETLDEYRTFIMYKGEAALSTQQRAQYDELRADIYKASDKRQAERTAVIEKTTVSAEMEIKETIHTKKNIPLWVVVLSTRVERDQYNELNARAKKLGGYYSSYRGSGAIPGFTFESKEAAELFTKTGETVSAASIKEEAKQERQQTKAEALRERGEKMIADGTEEMNRERQDNTHRRARMAASAEERAAAAVKFGKLLVKIADGIEAGTIKHLEGLSNGKQLEELKGVLRRAHALQTKDLTYSQREQHEINEETPLFAEFPYPVIYDSRGQLERLKESPGKKLAAARMLKRLDKNGQHVCSGAAALEDYETLYCRPCVYLKSYEVESYKNRLLMLKRIHQIGLKTPEQLRAAIRELIQLQNGTGISEEQRRAMELKALERQFIGAKYPGFFPTPKDLAAEVVRLAGIEPGNKIGETSAGLGHLADAVIEAHPDSLEDITCYEIVPALAEVLSKKGYKVINQDFLQDAGRVTMFDRIIMNPPFEDLQDITHVQHAYCNHLKEGGRLVAIMANNKHRSPDFIQWVEERGYYEKNEDGAFTSAFRPTGVSTITVILEK